MNNFETLARLHSAFGNRFFLNEENVNEITIGFLQLFTSLGEEGRTYRNNQKGPNMVKLGLPTFCPLQVLLTEMARINCMHC